MKNVNTIFGGPGCGKTTYLITLLEKLLKTCNPDEIALVSFTKKGCYEGRDRAMKKFGFGENDFPYFRTIHSLCFRAAGLNRGAMIAKKHYKDFSNALGMSFLGYYTEDLINNDDKYLQQLSLEINNPDRAELTNEELDQRKLKYVRENYSRFKTESGVVDFDDLLVNYLGGGTALPVKVAIIDEAQDLTSAQWAFCFKAFQHCEQVYIAGDDDQAIYEWSGADVNKFLYMARHSKVKILDKSYRLKTNILDFSKKVLRKIENRVEKNFAAADKDGGVFFHNDLDEIPINNEQSYYFLSRNNYFLGSYKDTLLKTGMQFSFKGKDFGKKSEYNAIKKYEELRKNAPEKIQRSVFLVEHLKPTATNDTPWYDALDFSQETISFWRNFFSHKSSIVNTGLNIGTIHSVKGGEADNVVLSLDITRNVNNALDKSHSLAAELRCLYVAFTRAKKNLHIIHSHTKYGLESIVPTQEVI